VKKEYFLYIIFIPELQKYYTGITCDLDRRMSEHRERKSINIALVHCEICADRLKARKLEKYFKSGYGREVRQEIVEYNS
jgi:putative endonuclease